jgi:hypothetical protein
MSEPTAAIRRELLVRRLEGWAGTALHRARRATYLHGWADADGGRAAEAAARALADVAEGGRGREIAMVAIGVDGVAVDAPGVTLLPVPGGTDERVAVALRAAGAKAAPIFGYLDASGADRPPARSTVAALRAGKPVEVLLVLGRDVLPALASGAPPDGLGEHLFGDDRWRTVAGDQPAQRRAWLVELYRDMLQEDGFPLVCAVELVDDEERPGELLVFATTSGKSLEAFKDALWAVDEFAGVRYRDPGDPDGHLLDISLSPHPGPLRRELLAHLERGPCTVSELRTFALTDTAYRAEDATRVLGALVTAGAVARSPEHGRLGGDVLISPS